jgi:hypothetical protein
MQLQCDGVTFELFPRLTGFFQNHSMSFLLFRISNYFFEITLQCVRAILQSLFNFRRKNEIQGSFGACFAGVRVSRCVSPAIRKRRHHDLSRTAAPAVRWAAARSAVFSIPVWRQPTATV